MTDVIDAKQKVLKMLIADDDPSVVRLLAQRCANVGFEIETASNGIQALLRANRSKPDILLIDVNMPKADGLSVCRQLLGPANASVEVVVVTGNKDPRTIERCKSLGAFYTHKGPDFWERLTSTLMEIFPARADQIKKLKIQTAHAKVQELPRVLLIDDDPNIRAFLSSRLGKYGVEMLYAANTTQGYRIACSAEPSVIICDYFMPNGDALHLLARLRTMRATEHIPFIVMTGRRLDEATKKDLKREICGRPGAAYIFKKSFDVNELFEALQEYCGFEKYQVEEITPSLPL